MNSSEISDFQKIGNMLTSIIMVREVTEVVDMVGLDKGLWTLNIPTFRLIFSDKLEEFNGRWKLKPQASVNSVIHANMLSQTLDCSSD